MPSWPCLTEPTRVGLLVAWCLLTVEPPMYGQRLVLVPSRVWRPSARSSMYYFSRVDYMSTLKGADIHAYNHDYCEYVEIHIS